MKICTIFTELSWFWIKSVLRFGLIIFLFSASSSQAVEIPKTCPDEPTVMAIHYGDLISCSLDITKGDSDVFNFSGEIGEIIVLQAARQSGGVDPCVQLVKPDGTILTSCSFSNTHRIDTTLDQSGNHAIIVTDYQNNETGDYGLSLEKTTPLSAQPIQFGTVTTAKMDLQGDIDAFFFEGSINDIITVQAARQSGGVDPCVQLVKPDGTILTSCSFSNTHRIDTTLDQSGNHAIIVTDYQNNETGDYGLSLQCTIGPCSTFSEPILPSRFENISTRGYVGIGHEVMIAGFIIKGDTPVTVFIRGRGGSLSLPGETPVLANPHLTLNSSGQKIAENDDCPDAPNWEEIKATGKAPPDPLEACILITLPPGPHGAIVKGADGGVGVGIVEVLEIND